MTHKYRLRRLARRTSREFLNQVINTASQTRLGLPGVVRAMRKAPAEKRQRYARGMFRQLTSHLADRLPRTRP